MSSTEADVAAQELKEKFLPKSISQKKLARYLELKALVTEFEAIKSELKWFAEHNVPVAPGKLGLLVEKTPHTSIPWKKEYEGLAGPIIIKQIEKKYAKNTSRTTITVTDKQNPMG